MRRNVDPEVLRDVIVAHLKPKQNSKSYIFSCPKCRKKDKLYIRKSDGRFTCFVCRETDNFQGRPEYALAELMDMSLREVKTLLYGDIYHTGEETTYLELPEEFQDQDEDVMEFIDIPKLPQKMWPPDYYPLDHELAEKGAVYLEGRGLPKALCMAYDVRYCVPRQMVAFPVYVGNRLVGWQNRSIVDNAKISTPDLPRDRVLMFQNNLLASSHAVLCEGPVDGLKASLCKGNVVTMGKAVSKGQLKILEDSGITKLYLGLDPDAAKETERICRLVSMPTYILNISNGKKDLGEMELGDVLESFHRAKLVHSGNLFIHLK